VTFTFVARALISADERKQGHAGRRTPQILARRVGLQTVLPRHHCEHQMGRAYGVLLCQCCARGRIRRGVVSVGLGAMRHETNTLPLLVRYSTMNYQFVSRSRSHRLLDDAGIDTLVAKTFSRRPSWNEGTYPRGMKSKIS